jgi:hypothetical protein
MRAYRPPDPQFGQAAKVHRELSATANAIPRCDLHLRYGRRNYTAQSVALGGSRPQPRPQVQCDEIAQSVSGAPAVSPNPPPSEALL